MRYRYRARIPLGPLHLNVGRRGLSSVSATLGRLTYNPVRRTLSVDTPGPGSVQVSEADLEKLRARILAEPRHTPVSGTIPGAVPTPEQVARARAILAREYGGWQDRGGSEVRPVPGGYEVRGRTAGPSGFTTPAQAKEQEGDRPDPPRRYAEGGVIQGPSPSPVQSARIPPWGTRPGPPGPTPLRDRKATERTPLPDLPAVKCVFDAGRAVARLRLEDGPLVTVCADHDQPDVPPPPPPDDLGFRVGERLGRLLGRWLYGSPR